MITKEAVELGGVSLNDIRFLMTQNYTRSDVRGLKLCWRYSKGVYWGMVKKGDIILYRKQYNDRMLINCLIYMHIDFADFLNLSNEQMML